MRTLCLLFRKLWKELFMCLSVSLTAHGLLLGYVPWCHVIDVKRVYLLPFTAEAVVSRFYDTGNVSVHVWNATCEPFHFRLLQETQMETPQATGRLEMVRLREKLYVSEGSVVGVSIGGLKTLMAEYHEDGTVYVSDACQHRDTSVVDVTTKIGQVRSFLDLALPFTLPLQLCTKHDCLESINELLDNEEDREQLHMSRGELLALVESTHSEAVTRLQPCNHTLNISETEDINCTHSVTPYSNKIDNNITETLSGDDFNTTTASVLNDASFQPSLIFDKSFVELSLKEELANKRKCEMEVGLGCKVNTSMTWTPDDDPTRNLSAGDITSSITPTLNGSDLIANQSDPQHVTDATTIWSANKSFANTSSDTYTTDSNQTYDNSTGSTSTEDWRTLTADRNGSHSSQNSTSANPVLNMYGKGKQSLPWWILNNSFEEFSLFADMINQHRHEMEMVPPPGKGGALPEHVSPVSADVEESHRYHTVVGLVIWNVVVTMLLFTVIVALFLVCTNKRRTRIQLADRDSYAVTSADERTKAAQFA